MRPLAAALAVLFTAPCAEAQTEVGSGNIPEPVRQEFVRAFFRGDFQNRVTLPPSGSVARFGNVGLIQRFRGAGSNTDQTWALVRNSADAPTLEGQEGTYQVWDPLFNYYSSVGAATAGFPLGDTVNCPSIPGNTCIWQRFDKNHALFVYSLNTISGTTFLIRDPFFTRWFSSGVAGLGPPTEAESTVTSGAGTGFSAVYQPYLNGAIYNITAGGFTGRVIAVSQPIHAVYAANRGHLGPIGLPTAEAVALPDGRRRQTFEGGVIEYRQGETPVLLRPVSSVSVSASNPVDRLNLGDTITLRASTFDITGTPLTGRSVSWVTSNSRVLAVTPSGDSVTVRAVGGGTASITAVSEGKQSAPITFLVLSPCCQIGEGSPTAAVEQSFLDAVARVRLDVRIPGPSLVRRSGSGYIQELVLNDGTTRILLAKADTSTRAYPVLGPILAAWQSTGGPTGLLGYPTADPTAERQTFMGGALAGTPPVSVSGAILTRWAQQQFEAGPAGLPIAAAANVLSFNATLATVQAFSRGSYVAHQTGILRGRAFLVRGAFQAKYASLGGPAGLLGLPASDDFPTAGGARQEFEGGTLDQEGTNEPKLTEKARRPAISANPVTPSAGSRVRIAAGGFAPGANLRISVSGQPDFLVPTETGAYAWEIFLPADSPSRVVNLRAADSNGTALAVGSFTIQSAQERAVRVAKTSGDLQQGPPGARLPQPLRVTVTDENGAPLVGVPVRFNASPGSAIENADAITDSLGQAQAFLRLPRGQFPALATAEAGPQVVTFAARVVALSLTNFPAFRQTAYGMEALGNQPVTIAERGALLTSAAAMVRYLQDSGRAAAPAGQADPQVLNRYLRELCLPALVDQVCDGYIAPPGAAEKNVNLWRLAGFTGGGVDVVPHPTELDRVLDLLARRAPVLVALDLGEGRSHFVAAHGVAADSSIEILDPLPAYGRRTLDDYINGFSAGGETIRGRVAAVLEFAAQPPEPGFLVVSNSEPQATSIRGRCGASVSWPAPGGVVHHLFCSGADDLYQLEFAQPGRALLTSLGSPAGQAALDPPQGYRIARAQGVWQAGPVATGITAGGVVNAASFQPDLSPGVLASVFGEGLAVPGSETTVEISGQPARVLLAQPFQVNLEVPGGLEPGAHTVSVRSPFGEAEAPIRLGAVSPAIFLLPGGRAAALNQDGGLNSATNPARRGEVLVVYVTGLGALVRRGGLDVAVQPVSGILNGVAIAAQYAGAAPGYPGLYQVNLPLPADLPPGLDQRLAIRQGNRESDAAIVAVQ